MATKNIYVFQGLHIIAWIIFVGLSIEAGGLAVNFFFSLWKPEVVHNLYQKLDLSDLYANNRIAFFSIYSLIVPIAILKACMFFIVVRLMYTMDLSKPFTSFVARQILLVSYYTLFIGFLSYLARQQLKQLVHHGYEVSRVSEFWEDSHAFLFMGAVVYIIAVIFKKGVDLQNENDLTV